MSTLVWVIVIIGCLTFAVLATLIPYLKKKKEQKQKKQLIEDEKAKINEFANKIRENIDDIDFGVLGKISKNKIDIDDIIEKTTELDVDMSQKVNFAVNIIKEWKYIIEKYSQYIINYFMGFVLIETNDSDNPFWEHYLTDENEYDNEKCLEIFRKVYTKEFEKETDKYYTKENTLDIKNLFKKHFPFFDYDKFMQNVRVTIALYKDWFIVDMNDKYQSCLCGAYEQFDKDLNGHDWHNF